MGGGSKAKIIMYRRIAAYHFHNENEKNMAKNRIDSEYSVRGFRATEEGGYFWYACMPGYVLYITSNCANLERALQIYRGYRGKSMY